MDVEKGAREELFADRKTDARFPASIDHHGVRSEQDLNNKFNRLLSQPSGTASGRFEKDG